MEFGSNRSGRSQQKSALTKGPKNMLLSLDLGSSMVR